MGYHNYNKTGRRNSRASPLCVKEKEEDEEEDEKKEDKKKEKEEKDEEKEDTMRELAAKVRKSKPKRGQKGQDRCPENHVQIKDYHRCRRAAKTLTKKFFMGAWGDWPKGCFIFNN